MKACTQCGKCCRQYSDGGLAAEPDEISWWQTFRPEIARYVRDGQIWMDPQTGNRLTVCPFLVEVPVLVGNDQAESARYSCSIYADRPDDCRQYPVSIAEMDRDGCEMLELRDLDKPVHAQRRLDALMSDVRPPLG